MVEYCRGIIAEHKLLLPLLVSLLLLVVVLYLSLLLLYFSYSKGDFGVMTGRRKINFLRFHSIFNCSSSFFVVCFRYLFRELTFIPRGKGAKVAATDVAAYQGVVGVMKWFLCSVS